jgi:lipoprotein-releasing system ATP-binding protein
MNEAALALSRVVQTFHQGETALKVLRGVDLTLAPGEIVALVGPSGAGKSTLLQIAGLLETAENGEVTVQGQKTRGLGDDARTRLRREALGFVYQFHHLLPEFSALENVVIPQMIAGRSKRVARNRALGLLEELGIAERAGHRPARLSGGEQQRVAVARALANEPKILLADEPTGNLDPDTARGVFDMLVGLARDGGVAALVATHNPDLAARLDRIVRLKDGILVAG